jgi:hypothetical protein
MVRKLRFYEYYGVEEFYMYDPDKGAFDGWVRAEGSSKMGPIDEPLGWVSPRLGIRFELEGAELAIYRPDGRKFASYIELEHQREQEHQRAEQEHQRAEQEHQRAEQEHQRAEQEHQRAEKLAARLKELGIDPAEMD